MIIQKELIKYVSTFKIYLNFNPKILLVLTYSTDRLCLYRKSKIIWIAWKTKKNKERKNRDNVNEHYVIAKDRYF